MSTPHFGDLYCFFDKIGLIIEKKRIQKIVPRLITVIHKFQISKGYFRLPIWVT